MDRNRKKYQLCKRGQLHWTLVHFFIFFFHFLISNAAAQLENGMPADLVLGQPNFTSGASNQGGAVDANTMNSPRDAMFDGKRLFVLDRSNHRVLIWNALPTRNNQPADLVLGQPDFVSNVANNGGVSARSLVSPYSVYSTGEKLFVSDFTNNRLLIWNTIPTENFAEADVVLGQTDFTSNGAATTQTGMRQTSYVSVVGEKLFVSSLGNSRTLIWNKIPTQNGAPADLVIGQSDFVSSTLGTTKRNFTNIRHMHSDGQRLFAADTNNRRLLIFNQMPTENFPEADVVIGQADFTTTGAPVTSPTTVRPHAVASDGERLIVADIDADRILIWNEIPTQNNVPADFVLGKPDFKTSGVSTTRVGMNNPFGVRFDGRRIFVADTTNNRVLIFDIGKSNVDDLGPQFSQGKAVVGKVFIDWDGDGVQDG